ncbi:hypothetical protein F4819DRAFT_503144 [Hypoxylon fuscum]|nr:hypothetical protein F4819DRAFT_503144 [Hypoxylon fuscum]
MPAFFIPARNSRHRIACLALYRALLQQAPRVPLPDDLATAWGPSNPLAHLVRKAFRRNRTDTSPRLVYPALKAGYQMLSVLRSASTPTPTTEPNDDHTSIIQFLRERLAERQASLHAKTLHAPYSRTPRPPSSAPRPGTAPLLVNVAAPATAANPHPRPVYATPSRPRAAAELGGSGRRAVPRLDMAADFPILRLTKPQPRALSRVLTQKIRRRVARTEAVGALRDGAMPDAEGEDDWDRLVAGMLVEQQQQQQQQQGRGSRKESTSYKNEGKTRSGSRSMGRDRNNNKDGNGDDAATAIGQARAIDAEFRSRNTYRQTLLEHGIHHVEGVLTRERIDQVARADAMRRLIDAEAALAAQEKAQRVAERRARWEAKMREGVEGHDVEEEKRENARPDTRPRTKRLLR